MHLRLFLSTFALIFIAELGDKTQLAAMARAAAGEGGKWIVFWGASSALVFATLLAVLVGDAIGRFVPFRYVRLGAGALFLLFGVVLLRDAFTAEKPLEPKETSGALTGAMLKLAAEFEAAAVEDYAALAARNTDPRLAPLWNELARAETIHLRRLRSAEVPEQAVASTTGQLKGTEKDYALFHNVATSSEPVLRHAVEHEKATAKFYGELARSVPFSNLRGVLAKLAEEERKHADRLAQMLSELEQEQAKPPA
ncbi:MAG: TMEM165/GDT1 family protein [Kiritimatiellia bacterium]